MADGVPLPAAARAGIAGPLTDDPIVAAGVREMGDTYLDTPLDASLENQGE